MAKLTAAEGELMFTNIKSNNPFRAWMETMADWRLIERDETDMMELLSATGFDGLSLKTDPTGFAWIAEAKSPASTRT